MWKYSKSLLYPINIKNKDLRMAKFIITQYGGPYGELGAALRYLNQRYTMPDERGRSLLTDIGTEELGHVEMICTMLYQLMKGSTLQELAAAGLDKHYAQHGMGLFPTDVDGVPFSMANVGSTGNFQADLTENLAAEQKAKLTYEHIIDLAKDPDLINPLLYLRQREVVHYNRFKDMLDVYLKEFGEK